MPEDDSADPTTKPLNSKYLSGLLDNISATHEHLTGSDGTPLSPSFFPPNAVWSPREKDVFFHALSVHSRFRPDLISHEIKTKSVSDVCNYLSALQLAASQQETTVSYSQWRQNLPIAMEVSSEWVAMEEETAFEVITQEQDWQREFIAEQRRAELKSLKKASKIEPHNIGTSRRKAELKQEVANANLRNRRKDFCSSLGPSELTAFGTMLREAANSSGLNQIKQSPSTLHTSAPQDFPEHAAGLEAPRTLPFSTTKGTPDISGADTAVCMTSNISTPFFTVSSVQGFQNHAQGRSESNEETPPGSPAEQFQSSSQKQDSTALLAGLSPTSRRRYKKRLYMRRKRASISGATAIDDSLERLKPGRKKAKRSPSPEDETPRDTELPTSRVHDLEDKGSGMSVSRADGSSVTQKRYPRAEQMAIDELRDLDLTVDELGRLGVDVVNPGGVAKMLNLWDKLSGGTSGYGSRISIETIQLLDAHVVWFVKSLIYRAIALREQEQDLKSETKVWKLSGKAVLTREHVERAVSMANSRELNKAGFFEGIIADMDINTEAGETVGKFAGSGPDVTFRTLHRDIYAPLVWMPELGDDAEMSDSTDDDEVDHELLEEEELDELDKDIEMDHESGLWDKAQKSRTSGPKITRGGQQTTHKSTEFIEDSD